MATIKKKALIIGAGTGGYPCAIRLGQLGVDAMLVEKEKPGGVCLNWGCIPTKALISATKLYYKAQHRKRIRPSRIRQRRSKSFSRPAAATRIRSVIVRSMKGGVRPLVHRPTVRPDSVAMRYASAMQLLLVDQFLADRSEDGKRVAKVARPLLSSRVTHAYAMLGELGVSMDEVRGFEQVQARVERSLDADGHAASEPTRRALGLAFERMTGLPGVSEEVASDGAREALRERGRALGGAIYLIDALDDLEKDHARGAFNPCLVPGR